MRRELADRLITLAKSIYASTMLFGVIPFKQNPFWSLSPMLAPMAFLLFLSVYGISEIVPYALIGGMMSIVVANSITMESDAAFNRLILKIDSMFVLTRGGLIPYAVGLALGNLINALPGLAVFGVLLWTLVGVNQIWSWMVFLGALTTTWAIVSMIGYYISTLARDIRDLWVYSPIFTGALSYLPPVFYPLERIPWPELRYLAFLSPTTPTARLMQGAAGLVGLSWPETVLLWLTPLIHAFVIFLLLHLRLRRPL
ncbi:MAG: hypothetical protein NZ957_03660 [Thaumarchaeota archaeon]|nr:hypothetical protein [Candidatus Calditenuaceae archaeon]